MASTERFLPIIWGILAGTVSFALYSLVVVLTTPDLSPPASLAIAMRMNTHIVIGMPLGIGLQTYLTAYLKRSGCQVRGKAPAVGGTATGSALSSFFSFFGLTQVGCCTLWLYYLSLLPSAIGVAMAAFIVRYSAPLSDVSLVLVWVPLFLILMRIRDIKSADSKHV